jgi:hypothetical protein
MRKFVCALYYGIKYDITTHRKLRSGEWTDPPPPGGYHIPAFDPTIPSGGVVFRPRKGKRPFLPWGC